MRKTGAELIIGIMILPLMIFLVSSYARTFATVEDLSKVKIENAYIKGKLEDVHSDIKEIKRVIIERGL